MKIKSLITLSTIALLLAGTATGCSSAASSSGKGLEENAEAGTLTIGISYDRPGLGIKNPDGSFKGFDVDVAKYVAAKLGVKESGITWKEAPPAQRENLIQNGQVDYIVNTYSINDARKERVAFAGPYFLAGQSLLVRADNTDITGPESLNGGKKLCSVTGSTPAQNIKKNYSKDAQLQEYDSPSACVEALKSGAVDAMTTDDSQLAGYASVNQGKLKLVGRTFSKENYGIGLKKDDSSGRAKINGAIEAMIKDGSWAKAFETNLGPSGYPLPAAPVVDRY
ncbi:glutamate ABC transporter substrate-binding protein [Arthrobacter sp. NPDC093128]|uniref:glutamate ABC transporter substrate-binding protein n=1 Tax=Arthrobacter sp. NPDC093128 TaxID=3154979 RepID=UPI003422ED8E